MTDTNDGPRLLPFRSDVRTKVEFDDLVSLYAGLPSPIVAIKTPNLAMAVLERICSSRDNTCYLEFPGHILNACEYSLVSSVWNIKLPSRVLHWLFDKGYLDSEGEVTELGRAQIPETDSRSCYGWKTNLPE